MKQINLLLRVAFAYVLAAAPWVYFTRRMKPIRADWLSLLKELNNLHSPFYIKVAEFALLECSFEANARDLNQYSRR